MTRRWLFAALVAACTPAAPDQPDDGPRRDGPAHDASAPDVAISRGPLALTLDGDPNGLYWDRRSETLYIADDDNNRVLAWRDGASLRTVATLPPGPPSGPGLGQLTQLPDGTLVIARFGDGTAGDVVYVRPDGTAGRVSSLDPTRRRIGISAAIDGTLYVGWFLRSMSGRVGAVSTLTLAGAESPFLDGLAKPVGVLAIGTRLFVSDQDRDEVLVVDRANASMRRRFAMLQGPDLLCEGPDGSLFAGSTSGAVFRIAADGSVRTFVSGYQSTRGVAYDPAARRLFIAEHDADSSDGTMHRLHIEPVDP